MSMLTDILRESRPSQDAAAKSMVSLIETARADSVFSQPVNQGEYTVILAAELTAALGFGFGAGGGEGDEPAAYDASTEDDAQYAIPSTGAGGGGGGGGGGTVVSRPVAAIEIGPHGVRVSPIFDPTKILVAFLTTLGAMFVVLRRIGREADRLAD